MSDISDVIGGSFDTASVPTMNDKTPLPTDTYRMMITDANIKPTKRNDGQFLELELTVSEGDMQGRKVWARLNIVNPNAKAVEIAMRELATIGQALGLTAISDTSELKERELLVKVVIEEDEGFGARNVIKSYKPLNADTPSAPAPTAKPVAPAAKPATPTAKPTTAKRPWEK
jgi:hypothetical protein